MRNVIVLNVTIFSDTYFLLLTNAGLKVLIVKETNVGESKVSYKRFRHKIHMLLRVRRDRGFFIPIPTVSYSRETRPDLGPGKIFARDLGAATAFYG
jgi:hypothetical protein